MKQDRVGDGGWGREGLSLDTRQFRALERSELVAREIQEGFGRPEWRHQSVLKNNTRFSRTVFSVSGGGVELTKIHR
jgi:hypothetical protein